MGMSAEVKVDNTNIIQTDIKASNGIIHVIKQVIMPNEASTTILCRFFLISLSTAQCIAAYWRPALCPLRAEYRLAGG